MKNISKNDWLIIAGMILWLVETWGFGWNETPCCAAEKVFDVIAYALIFRGILGGIFEGLTIKKIVHERKVFKFAKGSNIYVVDDAAAKHLKK